MDGEVIKFPKGKAKVPSTGSAGIATHVSGQAATVSGLAAATGGVRSGGTVETG